MEKSIKLPITGCKLIDDQHRSFFYIVKEIDELIKHNKLNLSILRDKIKELDLYVIEHLDAEEHLMRSINYPQYKVHLNSHNIFRNWITEYRDFVYDKYDLNLGDEKILEDCLITWLFDHITTADMELAEFIKENNINPN
ncbi:MAG TPA: hemerythrin family protein [Victivallales bacterium]|nr:hemerythrin family protein [Victivallales bacterium]